MDNVTLAMGSQFLTSFARLTKQTQSKVTQFIQKFKTDPKSSAIHYESITDFKDKKLRSVRIDQAYRGIILDTGTQNTFIFLWVDHHDEAYLWAKNKQYSINPDTGMIQFLDTETVITASAPKETQQERFFDSIRDREFKRLGIPELVIPYIRMIEDQADLNNKLDKFSPESGEILAFLASGLTVEELERELVNCQPAPDSVDTDDFTGALQNEVNHRSFMVITEDEELRRILEFPLEKWRVFLHPSQQDIVKKDYSGPVRILGGAGTGKTVVALHRAKFLAKALLDTKSSQKLLFTTFSTNLAQNIHDNLRKICEPEELERIEVKNLDAWARDYLIQKGFKVNLCSNEDRDRLWKSIYDRTDTDFELRFLQWEWKNIIQDRGISSLKEYAQINRIGAGTRIDRKQRIALWKIFQEYRNELDGVNLMEYDDVLRNAMKLLQEDTTPSYYKFVIVDESQDFSENGFNLIAQIAMNQGELMPNSLFIVGDSQQRIYGRKVILKHCGIPIQGRSKILKLNYRTTEEIGSFASQVLSGESFDDLDGETMQNLPYLSLVHGEDPLLIQTDDFSDEVRKIIEHLEGLKSTGDSPKGVCIVLRTNTLLDRYEAGLEANGIKMKRISLVEDLKNEEIYISTMHRVKGLEFDHIIVAGVSKSNLPNSYVLQQAPSQVDKKQIFKQERSLLYVALSRARKSLAVCWYGTISNLLT